MTERDRILENLRYSFEAESWASHALLEMLKGVTAKEALAKPVPNVHSIWEIVLHVAVWKRVPRLRLEGDPRQPTPEEDWPQITDTSEAAWEKAKQAMVDEHNLLVKAVEKVDDAKLEEQIPVGGGLTHSKRIWGAIQHDAYHNGQIGVIKKALGLTVYSWTQ